MGRGGLSPPSKDSASLGAIWKDWFHHWKLSRCFSRGSRVGKSGPMLSSLVSSDESQRFKGMRPSSRGSGVSAPYSRSDLNMKIYLSCLKEAYVESRFSDAGVTARPGKFRQFR